MIAGFVPRAGLEPARSKEHRILSPACLPIPPPGQFQNGNPKWSERRDSNPRPRPWQGRALPAELLSHYFFRRLSFKRLQIYNNIIIQGKKL